MSDLEKHLNKVALEKQAEEIENKYLEKIAFMAPLKKAFSNTSKRLDQGIKKMKGEVGKSSKGFEGTGDALKKDVTKIVKKNPLKATGAAGVAGAAGGAALSDD